MKHLGDITKINGATVPATSAEKALETQGEFIKEGYTNTAVVQI